MASESHQAWPEPVQSVLKGLERFDRICVTWIDASESTNVPLRELTIPGHVVETTIKSEGKFLGVQIGPSFSDPHLLILKEITERQRGIVESIPLALVRDLQVYEKMPRKTRHWSRDRFVFRYNDGVVKRLRSLQVHQRGSTT